MSLRNQLMVFILLSTTLSGCTTPDTIDEEPIGCTYLDALNFNDSAVLDDGSCQFSQPPQVTAGCSYEGALNFDETASVDDGSCQFSRPSEEMLGCIYSNALNFDENATEDDGKCVFRPYIIFGCDDSEALNFASNTTYNDGSCEYQTRHVLMVLVDGWRPDSIAVGYTPTIDSMLPESAYSMAARVEDTTISGSGHSSFLTGVHRDKHNVNGNNFDDHDYEQYPYWFRLLRDSVPDMHRSAYHNWPSMSNAALDDSVCSGCGDYFQGNDQTIVDELILDLASKQMNAATLVLDIMDAYGHSTGFNSSNSDYMAGMNQTDLWLGEIMDAIKARSNYQNEEWMVIISSDHAGTDRGHGYNIPEHRNVPLIIWGAESMGEIWPHPDAVDAVPTALHHLGVEIEPAWNLDGRVLGIEGTTKPVAELGVNLVFNGDGEYERGMTPGYDASIPGWVDNSTMTTWIYNIPTYLQSTDPGTEERGANYFGGGSGDSSIHQVIDLSGISEEISRGNLTYILSAFIGGYSDQDDRMEVVVEFFDSNGGLILYEAIGPVYAVDRNEITGIYLREAWGQVPEDSSWVRVTLNAYHETGYNDAYADDIVLVIS